MYITILGRQPQLGMAELERCYSSQNTRWFSSHAATVKTGQLNIQQLGGVVKAGKVSANLPTGEWRKVSLEVARAYTQAWAGHEGKITLGISAYGFDVSPREVQKLGIIIKQKLKKSGVSLRLVPNHEITLNTATSHHNKLGLAANKVELLVVRGKSGRTIIAESTGAQNITALAARDQARPKRDAFVGMLPPKLALLMINLAGGMSSATSFSEDSAFPAGARQDQKQLAPSGSEEKDGGEMTEHSPPRLLDPFCGTGVVLQEAALLGLSVYGTDLSDKMIDYTKVNLEWLAKTHRLNINNTINQADAMEHQWRTPIDLVVCETYLGQPFSAPPSPKKLEEVKGNVNHITTNFLKNLQPQLQPGTPLCLAVPAWRDATGKTTHLPFIQKLESLGYKQVEFTNVKPHDLLYYREDQVVARQLLVLARA